MALDWSDVDLERGIIRARSKGLAREGKATPAVIGAALAALLAPIRQDVGPVIAWQGRPVGSLKTAWNRCRTRAGLPHARLHDLRHSFAQDLEDAGHGDAIQDLLHHSTPALRRRYAKARVDRLRAVLDAVTPAPHSPPKRQENGG